MKTEKFAEINNVGYDKAIKLATLSLDKIERLAKLNLDTAKTVLANGTQNAGAITAVKDVPSLLALNAKFAEAGMKDVVGYSRAVYAIASEAQSELSALTEDAFAAYTHELGAWVEKASKNAPAGSDVAVNALKST